MKSEKEIYELIDGSVDWLIKNGRLFRRIYESHTWWIIDAYCDEILEINSVKYWNKICKIHPHLGDIMEE